MTASFCLAPAVKIISASCEVAIAGLVLLAVSSSSAATLLDDTFADGTRTNQNLPTDSAWFTTSAANMRAYTNLLSVTNTSTSSSWWTYFTPSGSPVVLDVGDTLDVTLSFTPVGVGAQNTSKNLRFGLYNSTGLRPNTDGTLPMATYLGYIFFSNFGLTWGANNELRWRSAFANNDALNSANDSTVFGTGANSVASPAFSNNVPYTLELTLTRSNATTMIFTATYAGGGLTNSVTATDSTGNFTNFDMLQIRPSGYASTATNFIFTGLKVSLLSAGAGTPPAINSQPLDQSVLVGDNTAITVDAGGTAPLGFQWYFNTSTPVLNATNATLTFTNAQPTNSGDYSVVITNSFGSVTSDVATLTVSLPTAPTIVTQPQSQTALPGQTATFNVVAGGTAPLNYQWYFNTNSPLTNATSPTLTLTNLQAGSSGFYSVVVSNLTGSTNSASASLLLNTNPVAPAFTTQPASLVVLIGGSATFSAVATGTTPIYYQWLKNDLPIAGATASTLNLTNVQNTDAGNYTVTASNSVNTATSATAVLTVTTFVPVANSAFNLTGFAQGTTGGGVIPETDPGYRKVYTALDLANAFASANKTAGSVKVVEIMNDLDLGWNEVGLPVQTLASTPFRIHAAPQLHPRLLVTGVSLIDIKPKSGLTIFSANGATIRHACFNIKSTANIIVRNLKFDEMWEWDEASKGNYDKNDWDFIDLGNGGTVTNIWIDHCTFTKSYDGEVDIKQGSSGITFSWCKYTGDDGATNMNSWVRQQISSLESNKTSYAMYNFLRTHGFSVEDVVTILQGHDKTHLIGANSLKAENALHTITFHHNWFNNPWDRLPRLRAGNVHNYNIYVDDTLGLAAKRLRDARANAMSTADRNTLNNTYNFNPFLNGSISTESGAVLVEKSVYKDCVTPLRNNQTDPANPVYTGKIKALDTIYQFDDTVVRGNSTDPGNPLGPFQAPIIAFSWNLPGSVLPYAYDMDDPGQLQSIVTSPTAGAGAGVLTWSKTNWLATSYASTAPFIIGQPQSLTVVTNQSATFTVVAAGSGNLSYQWYFNTNTLLLNATNSSLTLLNIQTTNGGSYSVIVTNNAGSAISTNAILNVSTGSNARPQLSGLVFSNGTFSLTVNGDAGLDYIIQASTNLTVWSSVFTNHLPSMPFIWVDAAASNFTRQFYRVQSGL